MKHLIEVYDVRMLKDLVPILDARSAEGWELVSLAPMAEVRSTAADAPYLKEIAVWRRPE